MPTDEYTGHTRGLTTPANDAFAITPTDATDLPRLTRGLYVGTGGSVALVTADGSSVTFANLSSSVVLPMRIARVLATGTTASDLVGLV